MKAFSNILSCHLTFYPIKPVDIYFHAFKLLISNGCYKRGNKR